MSQDPQILNYSNEPPPSAVWGDRSWFGGWIWSACWMALFLGNVSSGWFCEEAIFVYPVAFAAGFVATTTGWKLQRQ